MEKPPDKSKGDDAHALAKALSSFIPIASGPVAVMMETVFAPPLERRRAEWFQRLADTITDIQRRQADLTPERLAQHESFVSVALQATYVAFRNHQEEKLTALRNAILNSALPTSLEVDVQLMFVRFIDELTPSHLIALRLLCQPLLWLERQGISIKDEWTTRSIQSAEFVEHALISLHGNKELAAQLSRDLEVRGLALRGGWTLKEWGELDMVTKFGHSFIEFIAEV